MNGNAPVPTAPETPVPVILDTDIGGDIDDTWALGMLLGLSQRVDPRLVVTATSDTRARAALVAKILERLGRSDIPVGIGARDDDQPLAQAAWVGDWKLSDYTGPVREDGIAAMIEAVLDSPRPVTIVAIGPQTNIAEALRREPRIAESARFVAMAGGVYQGYGGKGTRDAEYNIRHDVAAAREVLAAPWQITWTPLDTCRTVVLSGEKYIRVRDSSAPIARVVIENYDAWTHRGGFAADSSSVLFDTVAVYLAFDESLLEMKTVGITIDDEGHTLPDENGRPVRCGLAWKDRAAFDELLIGAICT
ncbi:MAG: nucleoside hydrolase [Planctomycetota bacterium]|jgi:inosine-uridine nucleoside N-ribohydrolase